MKHLILAGLLILAGCTATAIGPEGRIVVAGDSVLAWNGGRNAAVADHLRRDLGVEVTNRATSGARFTHPRAAARALGYDISEQVEGVRADWVVMDGGANEFGTECRCGACGPVVDKLISADGTRGEIPATVARIRATGARILWAQYYTAPREGGPFGGCTPHFDALKARIARMAARDAGVLTYDMTAAMPRDRIALFAGDRIHPAPEGSARIAAGLAAVLRRADATLARR